MEDIINKAIALSDLIFVNGTLVKPFYMEGDNLFYYDLSIEEDGCIDINFAEIESYEQSIK